MSLLSLLALVGSLAVAEVADQTQKVQKELQGSWRMIGAEDKGEKLAQDDVEKEGVSIIIEGNRLILKEHGKVKMRFSFTLDPTQAPAHMDLRRLDKDVPGTCHAIYSLKANELKICAGTKLNPDEPEDRPQEFATGDSEMRPPKGRLLFVLQREKKH